MIRQGLSDIFDTADSEDLQCLECSTVEEDVEEVVNPTRVAEATDSSGGLGFNQKALQRYILHCAQNMGGGGNPPKEFVLLNFSSFPPASLAGLRDKPSKSRDYYHSCYALSGLSVAQWYVQSFPLKYFPIS